MRVLHDASKKYFELTKFRQNNKIKEHNIQVIAHFETYVKFL